ncbi:MAG: hypothetical protein JO362_19470 [Streptomycetaceae bacterium]|nr:hypothetical protein [Streptomycetaceae bacterium]
MADESPPASPMYAVMCGIWCGEGAASLPPDLHGALRVAEELLEIWGATRVSVYRSLGAHLDGDSPLAVVRRARPPRPVVV